MDTTIRNLDEGVYRALRARAVLEGRTVGELITEAIGGYLVRTSNEPKSGSLSALKPEAFPDGNDHLSEEIDSIVYGSR